jgi:serine/threonine protein kinase
MIEDPQKAPVGKCVNQYLKVMNLDSGSFGKVYAVVDRNTGKVYALKQIRLRRIRKTDYGIEQLHNEIHLLRTLCHPNLISLKEVLLTRESHNICLLTDVFEYGSLEFALASSGGVSDRQISYIFRKVVEAVAYLHQNRIVHQDIKPGNILLGKPGRVVLSDFGMSHSFDSSVKALSSPLYHAPEALGLGSTTCVDGKEDVWALGVTLHEMIFGAPPFSGDDIYEIRISIMNSELEKPEDADDDIWDLIANMLRIDPTERYSIRDVLRSDFVQNAVTELEFKGLNQQELPDVKEIAARVLREEEADVIQNGFNFEGVLTG